MGGFISYSFISGKREFPYKFATAQKGNIKQIVSVDGSAVADSKIELKFQTSGKITKISHQIGQEVKKGSVLAKLESRDQLIKVKQCQASLAQARANLDLKLAGASSEEIRVAETAVGNAEDYLTMFAFTIEYSRMSPGFSWKKEGTQVAYQDQR